MWERIYELLEKIKLFIYNHETWLIYYFMKSGIHPKYYDKVEAKCACGNSMKLGSTKKALQVEVCHACHPYYTGKHKLVDVAGRVDQFKQRMKKAKLSQKSNKAKENKKPKEKKKEDNSVKLG
jgi:large subunit ribosomal protein L31